MIEVGQKVPSVPLKLINQDGVADTDTATVFGTGTIVFFSVPGAFTPTCHNNHLPGFLADADKMRALGVTKIICGAVNDHHVVKAWALNSGALGKIEFLADGNAEFAKALGLEKDMQAAGMGTRFARAAMIVEDGIVKIVSKENAPGVVTSSGAPAILHTLETMPSRIVDA